ncbi:MAG: cell division protein FtsA, partial [Aquificaceae bacterium]
ILGISGYAIKSQNESDTVSISSQPVEINPSHIERLIERAITRSREEGYEVVSAIPRRYVLDDQEGILDPVGLIGSKLSAEVHVIKVSSSLLRNIEKVVLSAGINIADKFLSPLASAEAVLTLEEKEEGVLMIDMGAGLTDFVLFYEGSVFLTGSLPIGGLSITKDIAHFMKISVEQAEKVKIENGYALADLVNEAERIKVKPRGEEKEVSVSRKQLAEVIQIRLEEIMENISEVISARGINLDALYAGIVITGGCAKLAGIKEFLERYFDLPARIGYPMGVIGLKEKVQEPSYAAAVGLIKLALSQRDSMRGNYPTSSKVQEKEKANTFNISNLISKFKSFFMDIM